jgi:hypothetical protein
MMIPPGGFRVTREDTMFYIEVDRLFCLLNSPNIEAVEKHHDKYGPKC